MMVFCCSLHTFFFLESQSHRLLLESFFESLCCQVCIISLGEGDSEMQQSDFHIHPGGSPGFPDRMSPAAQATPSPWHSWFEVGNGVLWATSVVCRSNFGNICNLLLLEMTALHTEVGWLRCQKGAQPRVLWGHRKRPPPQGHKEWPFQGWTCDKSWFRTRPGLPVCWVPLRISGHLSGSGPHRELQTLFTEMRASCIWQVPWKKHHLLLNQRQPPLYQESNSHLPGLEKIPFVSSIGHHQLPNRFLLENGCWISHRIQERRPKPCPRS